MRLLGNILWYFPLFGFLSAINAFLFGLLLTVLIIPAPIGLGLIQLSKFLLAPYSYEMVSKNDLNMKQNCVWEAYSFIIMLFYIPFGVVFAIVAAIQAGGLLLSIVGIPLAIPIIKSLGTFLNPVGKVCVPVGVGQAVQDEKVRRQVDKFMNS